jgi:hypothetical protein
MAAFGRLFHLENTMNRTILNRLAALEARRPVERKPVDEKAMMASLNMRLAAICHKQPGESYLTGFARACHYRDATELFITAWGDRPEFVRRYAAAYPPNYAAHQVHPSMAKDYRDACDAAKAKEAGDVCNAVIREFIAEEIANQLVDAIFPFWRRPGVEPVELDDAVVSDIGRSLLALAARRSLAA